MIFVVTEGKGDKKILSITSKQKRGKKEPRRRKDELNLTN